MENEEISEKYYGGKTLLPVTLGQKIELNCKSEGGNPITSLIFTKNGSASFSGLPHCKCLNNSHTFLVTENDHGAILGCSSQNEEKWSADSQTVQLDVLCKLHAK